MMDELELLALYMAFAEFAARGWRAGLSAAFPFRRPLSTTSKGVKCLD
jgi:hypothetical protein